MSSKKTNHRTIKSLISKYRTELRQARHRQRHAKYESTVIRNEGKVQIAERIIRDLELLQESRLGNG